MAMTAEDDVTAAELAIGLLEGPERAAALRRVLEDAEFAHAVERWRERFATLLGDYPAVEPPAWIEGRLFNPGGTARPWRWATAASSLLAACLALALVLRPSDAPPPRIVTAPPITFAAAMTPSDGGGQAFAALFDQRGGQIRVPAKVAVPARRVAELWRIGSDGVPHSLGLLRRGDTTAVRLSPADRAALAAGATLAISIEPEGGSPAPTPTGPVAATGVLTRI
jgi:anti-sigma-K factor RskA